MKWLRWLRWTLLGIVVCAALAIGLAWWAMRQSLPQIEGTANAPGLGSEATIERDARGIPVIIAATRADLAYALGYAHAQDRFFQMDLSRRLAAGELSELFGERRSQTGPAHAALRLSRGGTSRDRSNPGGGARGSSRRTRAASTRASASLKARPWEYLLLRAQPREWLPEDSVLVVHSMWWQLQYGTLRDEIDRRRLERAAAARSDAGAAHDLIAFVYAGHSDWDTPNYSADSPCVQAACTDCRSRAHAVLPRRSCASPAQPTNRPTSPRPPAATTGQWLASTRVRASALIANDMHLDLGVPAVWYPARLRVTGGPRGHHRGHAAGYARGRGRVQRPGGLGIHQQLRRFRRCALGQVRERRLSGAPRTHRGEGRRRAEVTYRDVGEGVVLDGEEYADDEKSGDCLQAAWLATRPEATNFGLLRLEGARNIDDVLALAPQVGIPGQNMVVGDTRGRIAWTLLGRVPANQGPDRLFGPIEFLDGVDHPRIADPPVGRLWTANQRVVTGPLEAVMGDDEVDVGAGGYDIGARARQIRDGLAEPFASGHRGRHARHPARCARACSRRAGATCCWRSSTKTPCTTRRCAASFASWSARARRRPAPMPSAIASFARFAATR